MLKDNRNVPYINVYTRYCYIILYIPSLRYRNRRRAVVRRFSYVLYFSSQNQKMIGSKAGQSADHFQPLPPLLYN